MPGQLIFTTVPSGLDLTDSSHTVITIHVAPQLATQAQLTAMQQWTSDVANGKISFALYNQTGQLIALTPRTDRLRLDLWAKLFSDLPPFTPFGSSPGLTASKGAGTSKKGQRTAIPRSTLNMCLIVQPTFTESTYRLSMSVLQRVSSLSETMPSWSHKPTACSV
jgi:hypothetical protein